MACMQHAHSEDIITRYSTYIHTKLYLTRLASTTVGRLISMRGVKYKINYLQEIKKK